MNMQITGSLDQRFHNDYWQPYLCQTNEVFPKMYNGGWNDFHFTESVEFSFKNMPLIPKVSGNHICETNNYKWYSCQIEVTDKTGKTHMGYYYITFDKKANKFISENVDFS